MRYKQVKQVSTADKPKLGRLIEQVNSAAAAACLVVVALTFLELEKRDFNISKV